MVGFGGLSHGIVAQRKKRRKSTTQSQMTGTLTGITALWAKKETTKKAQNERSTEGNLSVRRAPTGQRRTSV